MLNKQTGVEKDNSTIRNFAYSKNGLDLKFGLNNNKDSFKTYIEILKEAINDLQEEVDAK